MSLYRTSEVNRIEREVVSEAMVDWAISHGSRYYDKRRRNAQVQTSLDNPVERAKTRRNIAIGIQAGSYSIAQFEAEQALRARVLPLNTLPFRTLAEAE